MPGVFRELRHWVDPDGLRMDHQIGVTYYALCRSPCLFVPEARRIWLTWPTCPDCACHPGSPFETEGLKWGCGPLQPDVAHLVADAAVVPIPFEGAAARCGTWITAPASAPTGVMNRRTSTRPCAHCVTLWQP